jgi:copper chaperone NosL
MEGHSQEGVAGKPRGEAPEHTVPAERRRYDPPARTNQYGGKEMKSAQMVILSIVVCLIFATSLSAQTGDDIGFHKSCSHCGMDRGMFDFSRMLIEYDDGTVGAVCSAHCAAIDLANNIDRTPASIKVADFGSRRLIDAEKAFWVVGGNKPGVMSRRGKWAFEKKDDADRFVQTDGGRVVTFEEAMNMAYDDMYGDTKMIRDRRKMKRLRAHTQP